MSPRRLGFLCIEGGVHQFNVAAGSLSNQQAPPVTQLQCEYLSYPDKLNISTNQRPLAYCLQPAAKNDGAAPNSTLLCEKGTQTKRHLAGAEATLVTLQV